MSQQTSKKAQSTNKKSGEGLSKQFIQKVAEEMLVLHTTKYSKS